MRSVHWELFLVHERSAWGLEKNEPNAKVSFSRTFCKKSANTHKATRRWIGVTTLPKNWRWKIDSIHVVTKELPQSLVTHQNYWGAWLPVKIIRRGAVSLRLGPPAPLWLKWSGWFWVEMYLQYACNVLLSFCKELAVLWNGQEL